MNTNIIKVKFLKGGEPSGRAYTYYTPETVSVNDVVVIGKKDCRETLGLVTEVNVPEKEIAPFKDKAKSILGKAEKPICEECKYYSLSPSGVLCEKGNDGENEAIGKSIPALILRGTAQTVNYGWCKSRYFKQREEKADVI